MISDNVSINETIYTFFRFIRVVTVFHQIGQDMLRFGDSQSRTVRNKHFFFLVILNLYPSNLTLLSSHFPKSQFPLAVEVRLTRTIPHV
jgi:hypothetical protein